MVYAMFQCSALNFRNIQLKFILIQTFYLQKEGGSVSGEHEDYADQESLQESFQDSNVRNRKHLERLRTVGIC